MVLMRSGIHQTQSIVKFQIVKKNLDEKYFFIMKKNHFENFHFSKKIKKVEKSIFSKILIFQLFHFFWKMKIFKIIFLHDEKIFFIQIFFYDLEFNYTLRLAHFGSHRECTVRGTTRNLKIRSFFVLIAVWVPSWLPTWWIFCTASIRSVHCIGKVKVS